MLNQKNNDKRRYNTKAEIKEIPNVSFKRQAICQNYIKYGEECDPQVYFCNQLDVNPNLLAWLFSDKSLVGKSYLSLSAERFEAFQDFYNSLDINF